ncbi:MAG TPA: hypothetical protein VH369_04450 [Bryobacteraceae bacterium]
MEWSGTPARRFSTGVSLHSHTLHSRETLSFLGRYKRIAGRNGTWLDLSRAWWTPPLGPYEAWLIERNHIEQGFGLSPLVSLTDHDDIEAPLKLRVLGECRHVPVSVEWTVPYGPTFFHLGVHNIVHRRTARSIFADMQSFTAASMLEALAANPGTLIVFNHPAWDEHGIGQAEHLMLATQFMRAHSEFIHAVELNGFRPWKENRMAWQMAQAMGKPIVAGGDRHALEPNTLLDLTNAGSFPEFVEQVRNGWSDVLVTNQYRESLRLRVLQSVQETLQEYQAHACGWRRWRDRVFYECDDGVVRPLMTLVPAGIEAMLRLLIGAVSAIRGQAFSKPLRTLRSVLPQHELAL